MVEVLSPCNAKTKSSCIHCYNIMNRNRWIIAITHPCSNFNGGYIDAFTNGKHFAASSWMKMLGFFAEISRNFVSQGPISHKSPLVQVMNFRRIGDKPLSETELWSMTRLWWGSSISFVLFIMKDACFCFSIRIPLTNNVVLANCSLYHYIAFWCFYAKFDWLRTSIMCYT